MTSSEGTGVGSGVGSIVIVGEVVGAGVGPCQTPWFVAAITVPSSFTATPFQFDPAVVQPDTSSVTARSQVVPVSFDT